MRFPVYPMLNYERNHSETNGDQTNAIPAITGSEVIPRINPKLFRERKELGICHRSVAFGIIPLTQVFHCAKLVV